MATFDTSRTAFGSATAVSRISSVLYAAFEAVTLWNDARITRKALSELSDRELDDIGLIRGDIDSVAQSHFIR